MNLEEFYQKFDSYYLELMNLSFMSADLNNYRKSKGETIEYTIDKHGVPFTHNHVTEVEKRLLINSFFDDFRITGTELTDKQILDLLNDSWRQSKVGAFLIPTLNKKNLIPELRESLFKDYFHNEHKLASLMLIDDGCDEVIKDFVVSRIKILDSSSSYREKEQHQVLGIECGFGILHYIEKQYNKDLTTEFYQSKQLESYLSLCEGFYRSGTWQRSSFYNAIEAWTNQIEKLMTYQSIIVKE